MTILVAGDGDRDVVRHSSLPGSSYPLRRLLVADNIRDGDTLVTFCLDPLLDSNRPAFGTIDRLFFPPHNRPAVRAADSALSR